jgi:AraC family transcriptional activator of pyochelin receptor
MATGMVGSAGLHGNKMIDSSWKFISAFKGLPCGAIRHIRLRAGLELLFLNLRCDHPVHQFFSLDTAPIQFAFHLAGHGDALIVHTPWRQEVVAAGPETAILSFNPDSVCRTTIHENQMLNVLNIYLAPDTLRQLFEDEPGQLPRELCAIFDSQHPAPCNRVRPLCARCRLILEQILACPYRGPLGRLYLEGKTMELLVLQLEDWQHAPVRANAQKMRPDDVERIRVARDLLVRHTEKPPTLTELARKIGLNETKLKQGFRQVFGATVHGYVRNHRLNQSREMLAQGRWTVTEIAHRLDFHDATHFIKHFKRRFGMTPGSYMKLSP